MSESITMLLVTDETGAIIGATHPDTASEGEVNVELRPLANQTIHKVEVPEQIARMDALDFQAVISHAHFDITTGTLVLPKFRVRHYHEAEPD